MKGKKKHLVIVCVLVSILLVGTVLLPGCKDSGSGTSSSQEQETDGQKWACAAHPDITSNVPTKCSRCGMDLVLQEGE